MEFSSEPTMNFQEILYSLLFGVVDRPIDTFNTYRSLRHLLWIYRQYLGRPKNLKASSIGEVEMFIKSLASNCIPILH